MFFTVVYSGELGPQVIGSSAEELLEVALTEGEVRIIATLDIPFQPEGQLSVNTAASQREAIASGQDVVLEELESLEHRLTARLKTVPGMGLRVDEEALHVLLESEELKTIAHDIVFELLLDESVPFVQGKQLHNENVRGSDYMVAILDSGIDKEHPAFGGRVVEEACFADGYGDK